MNPQQILIVQQSFAMAQPDADDLARRFYRRLFDLAPRPVA